MILDEKGERASLLAVRAKVTTIDLLHQAIGRGKEGGGSRPVKELQFKRGDDTLSSTDGKKAEPRALREISRTSGSWKGRINSVGKGEDRFNRTMKVRKGSLVIRETPAGKPTMKGSRFRGGKDALSRKSYL